MKLWRLNEYEWYAADTFEQAVSLAMDLTGCIREDTVDDSYAGEETNMDRTFYDEDDETRTPISFRDEFAKMTGPGFFIALE